MTSGTAGSCALSFPGAALMDEIIRAHALQGAKAFFWADAYDGLAQRARRKLWDVMCARTPAASSVREVVEAWSESELRDVYRDALWHPERLA